MLVQRTYVFVMLRGRHTHLSVSVLGVWLALLPNSFVIARNRKKPKAKELCAQFGNGEYKTSL
jgi:hypothetical protein